MTLALGLHLRHHGVSSNWGTMSSPLGANLASEEGSAIFWMAFLHDAIASFGSGLGGSFSLDEVTAPLPIDLGAAQGHPGLQDLESQDLWSNHPMHDPFVMVIKASVLLYRTNAFARRWKARRIEVDDDFVGIHSAEFRFLANAIGCLQ